MVVNRRGLALSAAAVILLSAVLGAQNKDAPKQSDAQRKDLVEIVKLADNASAGVPGANDFGLAWAHEDFLKATDKKEFVAFTLAFDAPKAAGSNAAIYWRVVAKEAVSTATLVLPGAKASNISKAPKYAYEDVTFVTSTATGRVSRGFTVSAGTYDVYVVMKETAKATAPATAVSKASVIKQTVTVPDFWGADLTTSSVIVASSIEPLKAALSPSEQSERPYALGGMEIVPAPEAKFTKQHELQVFLLIYNPKTDPNHKPDVTVEYNFYSKPAGAPEKFFNKTPVQALNGMTLPGAFDMSLGFQLQTGQAVPMASFPVGDYRLEIKITDKLATKTITRDVNFTVTAG